MSYLSRIICCLKHQWEKAQVRLRRLLWWRSLVIRYVWDSFGWCCIIPWVWLSLIWILFLHFPCIILDIIFKAFGWCSIIPDYSLNGWNWYFVIGGDGGSRPWVLLWATCKVNNCFLIFNWILIKMPYARYKQLAGGVVFVDELPKNATGKVLRKELRGWNCSGSAMLPYSTDIYNFVKISLSFQVKYHRIKNFTNTHFMY